MKIAIVIIMSILILYSCGIYVLCKAIKFFKMNF